MNLYRFSPITTEERLREAIEYIIATSTELCEKVIGERLPISYLTIFAHYQEEYDILVGLMEAKGEKRAANNGARFELHEPTRIEGQKIQNIRIRKPDPYRTQVGCVDFAMSTYREFKGMYLKAQPKNLRLIERPEYEMIEFFDPDFDVFAYVVSK